MWRRRGYPTAMPELPEVEFCRRALGRWTSGRRVVDVDIPDARVVRDRRSDRPSQGSTAAAQRFRTAVRSPPLGLERHGKRILWRFEDGAVLLHLGMTGRWTRTPTAFGKVVLTLDDGVRLTFRDPRLLGGLVPFTDPVAAEQALVEGLGPDALRDPLPALRGERAVKLVLMDQAVVAGLGNVQAMEALWRAGIDPRTPASTLDAERHARLAKAVQDQLSATFALLGDGDEITYVEEPSAPNPFPLYQREGEPCPACGTGIVTFRQAGRGTWWCPGCQPADTPRG